MRTRRTQPIVGEFGASSIWQARTGPPWCPAFSSICLSQQLFRDRPESAAFPGQRRRAQPKRERCEDPLAFRVHHSDAGGKGFPDSCPDDPHFGAKETTCLPDALSISCNALPIARRSKLNWAANSSLFLRTSSTIGSIHTVSSPLAVLRG